MESMNGSVLCMLQYMGARNILAEKEVLQEEKNKAGHRGLHKRMVRTGTAGLLF